MNRWGALAALLSIACAVALRAPRLDTRPLHNDEAVNAIKAAELWQHGRYRYDPDEYHGPTLHYATLPILALTQTRGSDGKSSTHNITDATLRIATVAFGVALIFLLWLFRNGLGSHAIIWAGVFTAVSPAMVFYSRYFIHEMLLIFFTVLTLGAGWRYAQTRSPKWIVTAGVGIGLMFATKETFVLSLAAMSVAALVVAFIGSRNASTRAETASASRSFPWTLPVLRSAPTQWQIPSRHLLFAFFAAAVVWFLFFSSFLTNFAGLIDSVRTYLPWLKRAGGESPHIHPWSFYLERLAWFQAPKSPLWSEAAILLLAAIGAVVSWGKGKTSLHRYLVVYSVALTLIYTVISYKTPWCLLNFYAGMILLAGIGAAWLVERGRHAAIRISVALVITALAAHLGWQAWRASITYASDRGTPYVYAQTVPGILKMVERIEGVANVAPTKFQTVVKVISPESDYWPLPWYLRRLPNIGWYDRLPADPYAPVVVVSSKLDARLDEKSGKKWIMAGISELRPETFLELYVELELWKKYVATLPRPKDDE